MLQRSNSGCGLTEVGERLLAGAEAIESAYASAKAAASSEGQTIDGTVRIGTPDGFGSLFLAPRVRMLTDRHPKLEIEILATARQSSYVDATTNTVASNAATIFSGLPSLYNHELPGVTADSVLADLRQRLSVIRDAHVLTIPPPPVQGLGSTGGFKMMLEDRADLGSQALVRAANAQVDAANKDPDFAGVFTLFNAGSPSVYADIDRVKAEKVGLTPTDVFSTLQVYLGSQYVNDFNYLGRTYEVFVQADGKFRRTPEDMTRLKVRNASGEMVPIGTVAQPRDTTVAYRVPRYNLFPAAEVQGVAAPGVATGTALHRMAELAHRVLPGGLGSNGRT